MIILGSLCCGGCISFTLSLSLSHSSPPTWSFGPDQPAQPAEKAALLVIFILSYLIYRCLAGEGGIYWSRIFGKRMRRSTFQ